jgi:hypothetical protein
MNNAELAGQISYLINEGQLKAAAGVLTEEIEAREGVDFQPVLDAYHSLLPMLPRIRTLTATRKRAILARQREHKEEGFWGAYFARVARSPFLTGKKTDWMCSFDWLLLPRNMTKVLEGNYDPPRAGGLSASDEAAFRMSTARSA